MTSVCYWILMLIMTKGQENDFRSQCSFGFLDPQSPELIQMTKSPCILCCDINAGSEKASLTDDEAPIEVAVKERSVKHLSSSTTTQLRTKDNQKLNTGDQRNKLEIGVLEYCQKQTSSDASHDGCRWDGLVLAWRGSRVGEWN